MLQVVLIRHLLCVVEDLQSLAVEENGRILSHTGKHPSGLSRRENVLYCSRRGLRPATSLAFVCAKIWLVQLQAIAEKFPSCSCEIAK